ncbi:heme oxygenase 2 [Phyllostomus discolor]|uniref:Heme oxygenase 2 n=1 Tax=Phyllostomus discolor TaxID=89673 RepID=A0A834BB03_9CHIR|nr:heme oxygenase 2 [Phyllostomus discolor]
MSVELETSEGVEESEKKSSGAPERENHTRMADLSELLKEGTKEAHDRAENTQFVKDFLKGNIKKELFKIFNELDQAGSLLAKDTLADGLPVHNGKGDVRKCPYYAATQDGGALEGSSCPFRTALAVLSNPSLQLILATSVALVAGLLAWYYM